MTIELLQTMSTAAFVASGVLLLITIALFFLLDVPKLFGDVSGRTAKKAIEAIRQQNESTGNKAYKPSAVNAARGKLTDKITPSGKLQSQTDGLPVSVGTEKFATATLAPNASETTILESRTDETVVLDSTMPLESGKTTLLSGKDFCSVETQNIEEFTVDAELSFSGSSEIIE